MPLDVSNIEKTLGENKFTGVAGRPLHKAGLYEPGLYTGILFFGASVLTEGVLYGASEITGMKLGAIVSTILGTSSGAGLGLLGLFGLAFGVMDILGRMIRIFQSNTKYFGEHRECSDFAWKLLSIITSPFASAGCAIARAGLVLMYLADWVKELCTARFSCSEEANEAWKHVQYNFRELWINLAGIIFFPFINGGDLIVSLCKPVEPTIPILKPI